MFKKGLSIYTGLKDYPLEQNLTYLHQAAELGYEVIFSSAHINEANDAYGDLKKIADEASKQGMKLILDVSRPTFYQLKLPENLYAIRLDYGFSKEEIVELSKHSTYKIELNASTLSKDDILKLIAMGLETKNIRASFNFYPKLYTGHDIQFVKERLELWKELKISTLIFIPSKSGKRPPMYEGLPSVEKHRFQDLELTIEELKALEVDEIAFGDAYASFSELRRLKEHQVEEFLLPFTPEKELPKDLQIHLAGNLKVRPDYNSFFLRCTSKRGKESIPAFHQVERTIGSVTIDNDGFLRYRGEICLQIATLPVDSRVNVVGKFEFTDTILEALKKGKPFRLKEKCND